MRFHINTRMCVFNTQVDVRFYIYIYINIYIYIYNREHANKFREAGQGVPDYIYIYIYRPATKLNLKTCFICIFIFLCPIGSRLAIPKPNHIRSPHKKQCIMHRTIIIFMVLEVPRRGGGVWLQNHKKCTGWHATSKLNLKTFFIYIFIFLCPIGSRPAIPKPNHIRSPHKKTMHNAQDYYHFHGFGSAQEGGGRLAPEP